jgi:hypothetical protein
MSSLAFSLPPMLAGSKCLAYNPRCRDCLSFFVPLPIE